jgi:hypothetical protein
MKKININEGQYNMLMEAEWNYHVTSYHPDKNPNKGSNEHNMVPYYSDNKFFMKGNRETGYFGSGTYFSTFKGEPFHEKYKYEDSNLSGFGKENPHFIKIMDYIYRVDFDLYRNLYRVESKEEGDILYTMCRNLVIFHNNVLKENYDNSREYQIIRKNSASLGLKCPSYLQLIRMAQENWRNDNDIRSFSTVFMEWNGYNGVNVSGVDFYDNAKHGSVIYDLSKVSDKIKVVNARLPRKMFDRNYDNTIAYSDLVYDYNYDDYIIAALDGKDNGWGRELNKIPFETSLKILRNYARSGRVLKPYEMNGISDSLLKSYLKMLYSYALRNKEFVEGQDYSDGKVTCNTLFADTHSIRKTLTGEDRLSYAKLIEKANAYYWVNIPEMLINLLNAFDEWGYESNESKKAYLNKLMSYKKDKALSEYEKEYIEEYYFD